MPSGPNNYVTSQQAMIHQLPFSERPRERCLAFGAEALSLRECIAVLLGSGPRGKGCMGVAGDLMRMDSSHDKINSRDAEEHFLLQWLHTGPALLQQISGLGPAQRARLLACFEIAKRLHQVMPTSKQCPKSLNLSILEQRAFDKVPFEERHAKDEWFGFIGVYKTGNITNMQIVARGARQQVVVDRQRLFRDLLLSGAPAFFLIHNHPSGDLEPSAEDITMTTSIRSLATELNLQCLSHLIVTSNQATSFGHREN